MLKIYFFILQQVILNKNIVYAYVFVFTQQVKTTNLTVNKELKIILATKFI